MGNVNQMEILWQGVKAWNEWRIKNSQVAFDLRGVGLIKADLGRANLRGVDLRHADFRDANLRHANLQGANLRHANFARADLSGADLGGADLKHAILIEANIEQAIVTGCQIYGLSVWDLKGVPKDQTNLVITKWKEPIITVDDLQVAQFIYLLLNNKNVRNVIDTITSKAVLILGRFSEERKAVLDAISSELRLRNYLPIVFDFTGPQNRDITETVSTLAHMSKFVIADITDAKSIPQELMAIVPTLPSVPVQPLLLASEPEYAMFPFFQRFPWVLETYRYENAASLISSIQERAIQPAEAWLTINKLK